MFRYKHKEIKRNKKQKINVIYVVLLSKIKVYATFVYNKLLIWVFIMFTFILLYIGSTLSLQIISIRYGSFFYFSAYIYLFIWILGVCNDLSSEYFHATFFLGHFFTGLVFPAIFPYVNFCCSLVALCKKQLFETFWAVGADWAQKSKF